MVPETQPERALQLLRDFLKLGTKEIEYE